MLVGGDPMSGYFQGKNIGALNHNGGSGTVDDPVRLDELVVTAPNVLGNIVDGAGGLGTGMQKMGGSFRLTNGAYNGNALSLKHYATGWGGGSVAQITTYNAAKWGSRISKGAGAVGLATGGYQVFQGYVADGYTIGYNTQLAGSEVTGGMLGSWGGAYLGAKVGFTIGTPFGGVGGPVGAVVGGVAGAIVSGWGGSVVGGATYQLIVK